ncbi:PREDICTED: uncharacterized protein LOC104803836 isoform X2 [Tarenaya hassleriana]|uniref:uncharacterized protein LOC104803836 isoform X2 n=1 Tax=Tarenaya hassleriana TaxID=28532 RepID=UPI00053CA408|nr:PREDICTED: uncharacterized protein LOC104803836 isoform X2 [Tarenaya hassleriana]
MQILSYLPSWISDLIACMGGCFGCCNKPPTPSVIAVDEPSKGLKIQGRVVKKTGFSDDFWSTSTCEMENSTLQSRGSVSSISTLNLPLDPQSSTSNNPEFVNHGLILWNQSRQQWLSGKNSRKQPQVREPAISWNTTYESLLSTNKPFPRRIPLQEMVHFLVDVWEQEGLYD